MRGSLLAPILVVSGCVACEVARATITATFMTSLVGVLTYWLLQLTHEGAIAPDWILGAWIDAGCCQPVTKLRTS